MAASLQPDNEILDDLATRAARLAQELFSGSEEACRQLGYRLAAEISRDWGGTSPYIPRALLLSERDRRIYAEFDGRNYNSLARKFKLSERRIRTIVARGRRAGIKDTQRQPGAG